MGDLTNPTVQPFVIPAPQDRHAPSYLGDVFLLNPANRNSVEGKTQRPAMQDPGTSYILLFFIPFLLVGIGVIVWAGSSLSQWNALNGVGIPGIAEISDKRISSGDDSDTHYLNDRFSDANMTYTHEQSVSSGVYNRAEIGAKLDITYVPDNPNIVALTGTNNPPWFPLGFGLCWNLLLWPIFVAMLIGIWGETLLERQEHIIGGQVVRSSGSIDSDGDFTLKLDYSFFSPTGNQIIHGSAQQARNNLNGEALPAQGAPLAILFRKDNHHKPF